MRGRPRHQYAQARHAALSADHLLRARRKRPSRRTAEQGNELAPSKLIELH